MTTLLATIVGLALGILIAIPTGRLVGALLTWFVMFVIRLLPHEPKRQLPKHYEK